MGSTLIEMQPTLIHVPTQKDCVHTPLWLASAIIDHFQPSGLSLDPCRGRGEFYQFLPSENRDWCEIKENRDFFAYTMPVNWIIGNPPYSILLSWIRHSFTIAENICYLIPLHRATASQSFLEDMLNYGGIAEILLIGTGTSVGFNFGHALAAIHYQKNYKDNTKWSQLPIHKISAVAD